MILAEEREQVVWACRRMRGAGLVVGTAGNVSVRAGDLVAISPSGLDYDDLTPELVGVHRLDGAPVEAPLRPSTELPLHLEVYRRVQARPGSGDPHPGESGVSAVVHTHAPASTALSLVVDEIPATHYYLALFGGSVRVAPYARFGTAELAAGVAAALTGRRAALMANHGAVCVGDSVRSALDLAAYLEYVCDVQLRAMSTGLPVRTLPPGEIESVMAAMAHYRQTPPGASPGVAE
ncbi:MAG: class II aldolase/adducin family protein [Micromonosporaceae bacterium]|nr:class II aldolase/adducin family protein [Micromonosporaceae bacterium]